MFADLYVTDNQRIFKTMQLFKLNALKLLLLTDKKHERHVIIEDFENRKFCCSKVMMIENCDDRK